MENELAEQTQAATTSPPAAGEYKRAGRDVISAEMKLPAPPTSKNIRHLGVIGDVHARVELLERAADALRASGAETIVCVGDIYGPGNGTSGCCKALKERRILTVRGNHDRWFLEAADLDDELRGSIPEEALEFLAALPPTLGINSVGGPVLVCHGIGTNDLSHLPQTFPHSFVRRAIRLGRISPQCKLVIHGHSHAQRQQTCGGVLFVTIGSLRSHPAEGCIMVDTETGVVSPIAY